MVELKDYKGTSIEKGFTTDIEKGGPGSGRHKVYLRGGSIGEARPTDHPVHGKHVKSFDSIEEAKAFASQRNKTLTPGEKSYYKMKYHVKSE